MLSYNNELFEKLKTIPYYPQKAVGDAPSVWAKEMGLNHNYSLPDAPLSRTEVRNICQEEKDVLKSYLIVMAWGVQGRNLGGKRNVKRAWDKKDAIRESILKVKSGTYSRQQAFDLFIGNNEIPGLGVSYFTKLLYFFNPKTNMYIMDRWTTSGVLLLSEKNIIRHSAEGIPIRSNNGRNYDLFCRIIDDITLKISASSGDETEQRIFSVGKVKSQPIGEFRNLVKQSWKKRTKFPKYDEALVAELLSFYK